MDAPVLVTASRQSLDAPTRAVLKSLATVEADRHPLLDIWLIITNTTD